MPGRGLLLSSRDGYCCISGISNCAGWALLYVVEQFLVAVQSLNVVLYVLSAEALGGNHFLR